MTAECGQCMGNGYIPRFLFAGTRPCWACGGSGRVDTLDDLPRRVKQGAKFARREIRKALSSRRDERDPCREEWEDWEAEETGSLGLPGEEDLP